MVKKLKLNLGCGDDIRSGFKNVDLTSPSKRVMAYDLNQLPLPFGDDSVDYIHCEHMLSYLDEPADFLHDLHRICKSGARIKLIVNHFSLAMSYGELRKKRSGFSYFTFGEHYWNDELFDKFRVEKKYMNFTRINYTWLNKIFNPFINKFPVFYERMLCYMIPASEIIFDLEVTK